MAKEKLTKIELFEKEAAELLKQGIRLNIVYGNISADEESELADKYPITVIHRNDNETLSFCLSNGKNYTF